jgi:hypothetical protein
LFVSLYFYNFIQQRFRADGILIPHLTQSPVRYMRFL